MTIDELLADLKAKHGDEWPKVLFGQVLLSGTLDGIKLLPLGSEYLEWLERVIAAGVAATWQPPPEVWASVPAHFNWLTGDPDAEIRAWVVEPRHHSLGDWWIGEGDIMSMSVVLPPGVDWRQAKWKRPEARP